MYACDQKATGDYAGQGLVQLRLVNRSRQQLTGLATWQDALKTKMPIS